MKLYSPMAKDSEGYDHWTYDSYLSLDECKKVFKCWEDGYGWKLPCMWVEVTDTDKPGERERIEVRKDYIFGEAEKVEG